MITIQGKRLISLLLVLLIIAQPAARATASVSIQTAIEIMEPYADELSRCTSFRFYKCENTQRYMDYRILHPDYAVENIIAYVNIGLDRAFYSNAEVIASPESTNVLVNKYHVLPATYVPAGLETINSHYSAGVQKLTHAARVAFEKMCADAKKAGYNIFATSGYRSYAKQAEIYDGFPLPGTVGTALTRDLYAARPGYSEHQTGLAVDVIRGSEALADTPAYKWYVINAYKYGFILRFPDEKENVTGYAWEPWHLRYVGVPLAAAVKESGLTYDEYCVREMNVPATGPVSFSIGITTTADISADGKLYVLPACRTRGCTYFRLRDIAAALSATPLQFDISWDSRASCVILDYGVPYSPAAADSGYESGLCVNMAAVPTAFVCRGTVYDLGVYVIDGASYVRLEALAMTMGLTVSYDQAGTAILSETT